MTNKGVIKCHPESMIIQERRQIIKYMVPSLVSLFVLCSLVQGMECNASCLLIIAFVINLTLNQPLHIYV